MRRFLLLSLLLLPVLSGCGDDVSSTLRIERSGWDSLRVIPAFVRADAVGRRSPLAADGLEVRVFDAAYDTLYAGPDRTVAIPDAKLGDRESLLVEACLTVEGRRVCEQEAVSASPKRVRGALGVRYPQGSDYRRGAYEVELVVERERFDGDGWERMADHPPVDAYVLARVENAPDRKDGTVRVPVEPGARGFDLGRYGTHDDFAFHLRSRLHDTRSADVRFELYAGVGREAERLAVAVAEVREKTDADRADEVRTFVSQAAEQLIERLELFDRARVYVDDWAWDAVLSVYRVEIEIVGQGGGFFDRRDRSRVKGVLRVREDGAGAVFEIDDLDGDARRAWREHVDAPTIRLRPLDPLWSQDPAEEDEVDADERRGDDRGYD